MKDHKMKPETLKLLQEIIGNVLYGTDVKTDFMNRTPLTQKLRAAMIN